MNIRGAKKGPGSVEFGIKFLQGLEKIIIDPERCPLSAREFINYTLEVDRLGNVKDKFPDKDNHSIDAIRYALEDAMAGVNTIGIEVLRGAKVYG
jgi:phage terminase large subunit